jgi:hypothetical protein
MGEWLPEAVLGTWDLLRDGGPAAYEEWASGLESMAGWPDADFRSWRRARPRLGDLLVEGDRART